MFKIVADEVWLDGWMVARLNSNMPATLRELVEDRLKGLGLSPAVIAAAILGEKADA